MSDYVPTITVQWRDYAAARREKERTGYYKAAPLTTEVRPNPLSMELRIVLHYFWVTYIGCLESARYVREGEYPSEAAAVKYEVEALENVNTARDICWELFAVTSPHAPLHIHSEHGCNDETCPAWVRGGTAARDNVHDWYTPDC